MYSRPRSERAQGMVEFALALPLLLLMMLGLFDLGRAIYALNTVSNAARVGTRVAIVDQTMADVRAAAVNEAVALNISPADVDVLYLIDPAVPGSTCAPIRIGCVAIVTVPYDFQPATPLIERLVGDITVSATSAQRIERSNP